VWAPRYLRPCIAKRGADGLNAEESTATSCQLIVIGDFHISTRGCPHGRARTSSRLRLAGAFFPLPPLLAPLLLLPPPPAFLPAAFLPTLAPAACLAPPPPPFALTFFLAGASSCSSPSLPSLSASPAGRAWWDGKQQSQHTSSLIKVVDLWALLQAQLLGPQHSTGENGLKTGQVGVILKAQSGRWWARTSAPILRRLVTCLANAAVLCALGPQKYLLSMCRAAGQADAGKQHAQCA